MQLGKHNLNHGSMSNSLHRKYLNKSYTNKKSMKPNNAPHRVFVKRSYEFYERKTTANHCAFQRHTLADLIKERKYKVQKGENLKIINYRVMFFV
jgi:hypothetical protein